MGCGCFHAVRQACAGQALFRPVDAIGADTRGEGRVGGHQQDQATPAAETCEFLAEGEIDVSVVAPDDPEAAR